MAIEIMNDVARRVRRGVNFLDVRMPTWRTRINGEELNMGAWDKCIFGQLFDEYSKGKDEFCFTNEDAEWYGFNVTDEEIEAGKSTEIWAMLTEAWKAELHQEEVSHG